MYAATITGSTYKAMDGHAAFHWSALRMRRPRPESAFGSIMSTNVTIQAISRGAGMVPGGVRKVRRACSQNVRQARPQTGHVEGRRRRCRREVLDVHELPVRRYHIDVTPVLIHTDVYASAHVCRARDRHRTVLSGGPRTLDQSQRHKSASAVSTLPHRSTSDTCAHNAIGRGKA